MDIRELAELVGENRRQLSYLRAEGFMPPPEGGRRNASYGEAHVKAVRLYQRLRAEGYQPQVLKELLVVQRLLPVEVAPGIRLMVDLDAVENGGIDLRRVPDQVRQALMAWFPELMAQDSPSPAHNTNKKDAV